MWTSQGDKGTTAVPLATLHQRQECFSNKLGSSQFNKIHAGSSAINEHKVKVKVALYHSMKV